MKASCVLVVSVLCLVVSPVSVVAQTFTHVRPLDDLAESAFDRGLAESPAFRRLVAELEQSDLIVHVLAVPSLLSRTVGTTRLVANSPPHRYVRITIAPDLSSDNRTAILAHELQHACEIARSDARTNASVRSLFESIGLRVPAQTDAYETSAAIEVGSRVWSDLHHTAKLARSGAQEQ